MHRKEIAFDLNIKELEKFYNSASTAYDDIRRELEGHGFEHRQGSVYNSKSPMTDMQIAAIIDDLCKRLPWLAECAEQIDVTNIGQTHSLLASVHMACSKYEDLKDQWTVK